MEILFVRPALKKQSGTTLGKQARESALSPELPAHTTGVSAGDTA